jgi:hypothetical protein
MTPSQNKAILDFESISGFEFMHQDEVNAGTRAFKDAWAANVRWLNDMVAEVEHISYPYDEDDDATTDPPNA